MAFGNKKNQVRFVDVTRTAGLFRKSQSWGVSWGDYNGDGRPDAYIHGHQNKPVHLYKNLGNGRFQNVARSVFAQFLTSTRGDFHSATFGDFDNDGDQDLLQISGGDLGAADDNPNKNNKLFVNAGNKLTDRAKELGVQYPLGRGRVGFFFDIDQDGRNDIVYTAPPRPDRRSRPTIFRQINPGKFTDIGNRVRLSLDVPNGTFGMISDLDHNDRPDLVYYGNRPAIRAYKTNTRPFKSIDASILAKIPKKLNIKDIAIADLNGDAFVDMYIAQQGSPTSGYRQDSRKSGRAVLDINREEQGLSLKTFGDLTFNFVRDFKLSSPSFFLNTAINPQDIYLGSQGRNPSSLRFNLDASKLRYQGLAPRIKGRTRGVFIGYNPNQEQWNIRFSSPKKEQLNFIYRSSTVIQKVSPIGFPDSGGAKADYLFIYNPKTKQYEDKTQSSGLGGTKFPTRNVIAADLDNDMDQDIYAVVTRNTKNVENVLLENLGNGRFRRVPNAAGLTGTKLGLGDTVAFADYNLDGFLDPLVVNGDVLGFSRPFFADGSAQLFRNRGNNNHWIQIDLRGRKSNRDGIGAKVYVTAGGTRQLREQNGGIHNRGQNFQRLHFGLGENKNISKIEVKWTSGKTQILRNIKGDRVIRIDENSNRVTSVFNPANRANLAVSDSDGLENLLIPSQDKLIGGQDKDTLQGSPGNDLIKGKKGDDRLIGRAGQDTLVGGSGDDRFVFRSLNEGQDHILDFNPRHDQIILQSSGFGDDLKPGDLNSEQFVRGIHNISSGTRLIYRPLFQELWFDPDGSGPQSAKILANFTNKSMLNSHHIHIE